MPFDMTALLRKTRKPEPRVSRRAIIVAAICQVIREDWREGRNPTLLNHEGALWAALRSGLCLEGLPWAEADHEARDMLQLAFAKTGAKRPTWQQGQREFTEAGVIRETRLRCAQCDAPLEPEQKTFCSRRCADAHKARRYYQDNIETLRAIQRVQRARRQAAKHG